jgi:hypothetical protein
MEGISGSGFQDAKLGKRRKGGGVRERRRRKAEGSDPDIGHFHVPYYYEK